MSTINTMINMFLHLDKSLGNVIATYGIVTYILLFTIIFIETGLVITPFLPGDSLVFAAGAFAAIGKLDIRLLLLLLCIAAVLGDTVNYEIGKLLGSKLTEKENPRFLKREYLDKTHGFYEKYGGKTIIIARFVPIVRTFAPFVAGVGKMSYKKFISFNAIGGVTWVFLFSLGGFFFGNMPVVKRNFSIVILAIIFVSILPGIIAYLREKLKKGAS
jgi:membrane-associated protein